MEHPCAKNCLGTRLRKYAGVQHNTYCMDVIMSVSLKSFRESWTLWENTLMNGPSTQRKRFVGASSGLV